MHLLVKLFIKNRDNIEDNEVRGQYTILCGITGVICNCISSAAKIIIGILAGSISIMSDGLNNLGDIITSLVSIVSAKLSNKEADEDHPFGHGRYEYVASLIVGFLIIFVAFELLMESIDKIKNPSTVNISIALYIVLGISLLIKFWMFVFNNKYGKKINSEVLKATAIDSISDVITTTVVLGCTIAGQYTSFPIDGVAGILVAALIAFNGIKVAKESIGILLGTPPTKELSEGIEKLVMGGEGILGTHDMMVHNYGPGRYFASIHAEVSDKSDIVKTHEVIDALEGKAYKELNVILTIHMDPISTSADVMKHKGIVDKVIKEFDKDLSFHDFRMVDGVHQINLIFDLVIPYGYGKEKGEIVKEEIIKKLKKIDKRYYFVIKVESKYI